MSPELISLFYEFCNVSFSSVVEMLKLNCERVCVCAKLHKWLCIFSSYFMGI